VRREPHAATCRPGRTAMTFVFGVLGALLMIVSLAFGMLLAIAEGHDKRHPTGPKLGLLKLGQELPTPSDVEWLERMKVLVRMGFWGGLILTWCSALVAVT